MTMSPHRIALALLLAAACASPALAPPTPLKQRIYQCFVDGAYGIRTG